MTASICTRGRSNRWNHEDFNKMAILWKLSEDEQDQMREFEQRLADPNIDHRKNDPYEAIRYYKEYKGNLDKAEKMFRYMIQWRNDNNMETFLDDYGNPDPLFHQMPISVLDTTDRDGDPIYVDRMGAADSWGLLKHFGTDAMTQYIIMIRELQESRDFWRPYEDKVGHRVRNFTVIIDLEGLSATHMRPGLLPLLNRTARVSQDCYAGWGKRIILLRAPVVFKFIWSIAKHFFDKPIQDMIVFTTGSDYLEVVQDYIDLDALPPCIAPTEGKGKAIPGYFERVSLEGGPLDKTRPETVTTKQDRSMGRKQNYVTSVTESMRSSSERLTEPDNVNVSTTVMVKGFWNVGSDNVGHSPVVTAVRA